MFRKFIKYSIVGISNTFISYLIFVICVYLFNIHYSISLLIAYIIGISNSFFWNKIWTFQSNGSVSKELRKFVIVSLLAMGLNLMLLTILIDYLLFEAAIAQALAVLVITTLGFIGHGKWSFKSF